MTRDLKALRRLINQADLVLATIPNPHPSIKSARESLSAALALSGDLAGRQPDAVALGAKGGKATAKRGPEYFGRLPQCGKRERAGGQDTGRNRPPCSFSFLRNETVGFSL